MSKEAIDLLKEIATAFDGGALVHTGKNGYNCIQKIGDLLASLEGAGMSESYRNEKGFVVYSSYGAGILDEGGPIKPSDVSIKLFSADKDIIMGVGTDDKPYKWHYTEGVWRVFGLSEHIPEKEAGNE